MHYPLMIFPHYTMLHAQFGGLVQERRNSIADALKLRLSCIKCMWEMCKIYMWLISIGLEQIDMNYM